VTKGFEQYPSKSYGVYIIRQRDTNIIIYIGKAGELNEAGQFKNQDLPRRLRNTRDGDINANRWFKAIVDEYGPITLQYIITSVTELPKSITVTELPKSIESMLLAAYFADYGCLPAENANHPMRA